MDIAVILGISRTHLLTRLRQSVIAALGVTFGITMFITLVSFMTGLNNMLDGLVTNRTPHILLYNKVKPTELQPVDLFPSLSGVEHCQFRATGGGQKGVVQCPACHACIARR